MSKQKKFYHVVRNLRNGKGYWVSYCQAPGCVIGNPPLLVRGTNPWPRAFTMALKLIIFKNLLKSFFLAIAYLISIMAKKFIFKKCNAGKWHGLFIYLFKLNLLFILNLINF